MHQPVRAQAPDRVGVVGAHQHLGRLRPVENLVEQLRSLRPHLPFELGPAGDPAPALEPVAVVPKADAMLAVRHVRGPEGDLTEIARRIESGSVRRSSCASSSSSRSSPSPGLPMSDLRDVARGCDRAARPDAGLRGPARRAIELSLQRPSEQLGEPARDRRASGRGRCRSQRRRARAARPDPRSRCSPSRSARTGSRRARRPTRRGSSRRRRARPTHAAYPVLRVLWRCAPTRLAEDRDALDETPTGRGVATPIVSASTISSAPSSCSQRSATRAGIDLSFERAAPCARDRDRGRHLGGREDRAHALERFGRAMRSRFAG